MTKDELEQQRRGERQIETVDPETGELSDRVMPDRGLEGQAAS